MNRQTQKQKRKRKRNQKQKATPQAILSQGVPFFHEAETPQPPSSASRSTRSRQLGAGASAQQFVEHGRVSTVRFGEGVGVGGGGGGGAANRIAKRAERALSAHPIL